MLGQQQRAAVGRGLQQRLRRDQPGAAGPVSRSRSTGRLARSSSLSCRSDVSRVLPPAKGVITRIGRSPGAGAGPDAAPGAGGRRGGRRGRGRPARRPGVGTAPPGRRGRVPRRRAARRGGPRVSRVAPGVSGSSGRGVPVPLTGGRSSSPPAGLRASRAADRSPASPPPPGGRKFTAVSGPTQRRASPRGVRAAARTAHAAIAALHIAAPTASGYDPVNKVNLPGACRPAGRHAPVPEETPDERPRPAGARDPALDGNNAPVHDEIVVTDLPVIGELPRDLNGVYVRNGPNPWFPPQWR